MPITIEKEANTISEATLNACEELGVTRNDVNIEILQESSKGILGIGSKKAKIRVTLNNLNVTEKGLKAKHLLEELIEYFLSSSTIELNENEEQIRLNIISIDDKGIIIGKRGETLQAMEYVVGRISSLHSEEGREKRVFIDVDGYKERRESTVVRVVKNAARKAKRYGKKVALESMPPSERKIAYQILKNIRGVKVDTKQNGSNKTIFIIPTSRGGSKPRQNNRNNEKDQGSIKSE